MGDVYRFDRRGDVTGSPDPGDPREQRIACRRILTEMVREELAEGNWGWFRRRALIRLARRLHLDEFEARLLIRAAEYEYAGGEVLPPGSESNSMNSDYYQPVHPVAWNTALTVAVIAILILGVSAVVWVARLVS